MNNGSGQQLRETKTENGKENGKNFGNGTKNNGKTNENSLTNGRTLLLEKKMPDTANGNSTSKEEEKEEWELVLKDSVKTAEQLAEHFPMSQEEIEAINKVRAVYPMKINKHAVELIRVKGDPIWDQFVPNEKELFYSDVVKEDPLNEEGDQPVPGVPLTHRYPDRVLFLICNKCAAYCRHCTRKRRVGKREKNITQDQIVKGVEYIQKHKEIRDVILSGGDPLMLKDDDLEFILQMVRSIKHVEIIRIGSRMPCTLPQRITPKLLAMLRKYHPLYMNVQFNHPWELSKEARQACNDLADAGIPLGNQSVLLRGVNDNPDIFKSLCHEVLKLRVKPYYLYQCDLVRGTEHFRVKTLDGIEMMNSMRGFTTGFATPKFVIDSPGGGGKIEVFDKNTIVTISPEATYVKNRMGEVVRYPEPRENQLFSEETRKDANGKDKIESKIEEKLQVEQTQQTPAIVKTANGTATSDKDKK